jgi:hypothetical protein
VLDELLAFVGKKQKGAKEHEIEKGNQYTFVETASSARPIAFLPHWKARQCEHGPVHSGLR